MSEGLSLIKAKPANAQAAGRFTAMKKARAVVLLVIKNAREFMNAASNRALLWTD